MRSIKHIIGALFLLAILGGPAAAQLQPIPTQQSPAAGEGSHVFGGTLFSGLTVTWNAGTGARYLMLFDGVALPSNGSTTTCTTTQATGCLAFCLYLTESTTAPNRFTIDYTLHPIPMRNGVVAALSTGAGCGTLTVDTGADWFVGQVR